MKLFIKNIFKRFLNAGIRAYSIPTLPDNIIKIQSYPIVRIVRFLGGVCFLMILSENYLKFPFYFLYIFYFFALIFTIYHIIITFYRFKHMVSIFKSDKFDIRNSPLDRLATLGAKALWCLKGACETAQPLGVTLGLMISTDAILKDANREPIFTPLLAGALNQFLPEAGKPSPFKVLQTELAKMEKNDADIADIERAKEVLDTYKGGLSAEDVSEFKKILNDNKKELIENNDAIKKDLYENLTKKK